jgi:serine/threonine protein kinase/DNA-binding LacI/PurR family transcriptional regulator
MPVVMYTHALRSQGCEIQAFDLALQKNSHLFTLTTMQTDSLIGRQIDDYIIEERIGRGGMSVVYRARQLSVRRSVALKVISLDSAIDNLDEFKQRFAREAEVIARLEHLHIMPVYGYGIIGTDLAYLAMRLLTGGTLAQMIGGKPLPFDQVLRVFRQVASGLDYAHQRGIVHRDLKPGNILFDDLQNAYLADFGLAKLVESSEQLTQSGSVVGTPMYMSPEQLRGQPIDHRSDIYGMGVLLYHMMTGVAPFSSPDGNLVAIIYQHLEQAPRPMRELNPDVPEVVESVVMTALAKKPDDRFTNMSTMAMALQSALERASLAVPDTSPLIPHTPPFAMRLPQNTPPSPLPAALARTPFEQSTAAGGRSLLRQPAFLVTLVLLLAAVLAGGAVLLSQQRGSSPLLPPTVIAGDSASADRLTPTTDQIARAQQRLGSEGFVAYITCNTTSEYHATQTREMGDMAARYGLSYRAYDSDSQRENQIPLIERARIDGAVALIICPLDPDLLDNTLNAIDVANVPLVLMNGNMESHGGVLIAGDDYAMGLSAGRVTGELVRDAGGGNVRVIILDFPQLPQIITRADGLEEGFLEIVPDAEIVGRYLGATQENGQQSIEQLLEDDVAFDVILSINDAGAFGAINALAEADVDPAAVTIGSVDAEALAREYIEEGYYMRASLDVGRAQFSQAAIDAMVGLLAGSTLPERVLAPPGDVIVRNES